MKIKYLYINGKKFIFKKRNVIYSQKNSVGKTSLIRMILYSIGYNIPSTKGLDFRKFDFQTELIINNKPYKFFRDYDYLLIKDIYDEKNMEFSVKTDELEILSILYGLTNPQILRNVIGTFYFDQEKGWTLLNRGNVIGNIHFSIEDLIEGLSSDKLLDLNIKLKKLKKEKRMYLKIKPLLEASKENYKTENDYSNFNTDELEDRIKSTRMSIKMTNNKISTYKKLLLDNKNFSNFIDNMKLRIKTKHNDTQIIEKKDIVGFKQNQNMIIAQITRSKRDLEQLEKNMEYLKQKLNSSMSLISLESKLDKFQIAISNLNLSTLDLEGIINQYTNEITSINNKIKKELYMLNITTIIFNRIKDYASILGISDILDNTTNFLFTSNLKRYSGAKLHLLVFAFRLALLKEIQNKTKETLPIILDSPMSSELDNNNIKNMFKLINEQFHNNQIIVATIADLYDIGDFNNTINIKEKIFE